MTSISSKAAVRAFAVTAAIASIVPGARIASGDEGGGPIRGEVRRIDAGAGTLTVRHAPIAHLDMPAMTMDFRLADPRGLEGLVAGAEIEFDVRDEGGVLVIHDLRVVD